MCDVVLLDRSSHPAAKYLPLEENVTCTTFWVLCTVRHALKLLLGTVLNLELHS